VLRDLAAETGETVNLGVLYGDQVLFVARLPRRDTLVAANLRVGSTVPAVFSSIGKTILAYLSPDELAQRVTADSFRGTWGPQAVTTLDALSAQLELARRDGYLVQRDEAIPGLSSIAAPIRQAGDTVSAAVNVANTQLIERLLEPLLGASREISRRMGGTAPRVHGQYRRVLK
jgi:IclR family pca regulon transcriptional regulator